MTAPKDEGWYFVSMMDGSVGRWYGPDPEEARQDGCRCGFLYKAHRIRMTHQMLEAEERKALDFTEHARLARWQKGAYPVPPEARARPDG